MTFLFLYALSSFLTLVLILNYNLNVVPRKAAQAALNGDPPPEYVSKESLTLCLLLSPFFLAGISALIIVKVLGGKS